MGKRAFLLGQVHSANGKSLAIYLEVIEKFITRTINYIPSEINGKENK